MAKYYHNINGVNIAFTEKEEAAQDILVADYNSKSIDRKLKQHYAEFHPEETPWAG